MGVVARLLFTCLSTLPVPSATGVPMMSVSMGVVARLLFTCLSTLPVPSATPPHIHRAAGHTSTEEHVKDFLSGHVTLEPMRGVLIFIESMPVASPTPGAADILISIQVILALLLWFREHAISISNSLESFRSSRRLVFIWMKGKRKFSISFLQFSLR